MARWARRRSVALGGGSLIVLLLLLAASPGIYVSGAGRLWDRAEPEVHPVILLGDRTSGVAARQGRARLFRIPATGVAPRPSG
jgi:hypothetical protein